MPGNNQDEQNPSHVQSPDQNPAEGEPGHAAYNSAPDEPECSRTNHAEADQAVHARTGAGDADDELVTVVLDEIARAIGPRHGRRDTGQRIHVLDRCSRRCREHLEGVLEQSEIRKRPRQEQESKREPERNQRPRTEQQHDARGGE